MQLNRALFAQFRKRLVTLIPFFCFKGKDTMSVSSDRKSAKGSAVKSGGSRTSISVTLPPAQLDSARSPDQSLKVTSRQYSPTRAASDAQYKYGNSVPSPEHRNINTVQASSHRVQTRSHKSDGTVPPVATPAQEQLTAQQYVYIQNHSSVLI